ncbi:MAG: tryptophan--tRNA ligase [Nisaea sp.]|jgi:tryptophanyl-tRNA synthetase|nr:tryptophan--tRNA ligase [Nisaea sp.]OUX92547.1 MAG: tryptophan--tRNA ligase [Candidatus Endolissoclinum sp. TMED26]|tara:strand:+ start:475 stop:1473 length:999 start_codon:yes stop_codon:yes gene_type:complete
MDRIFSGVQPTGNLHLGNYLGAIRNWARLQDNFECIYCLVDLHAITSPQAPADLLTSTREATAGLLAAGIDPTQSIIFNQSQVSAHAELAWIFNCVARIGWLNRMTQFKEKAGKNRDQASVGLYGYPVLMAADILAYKATHVPVGDDQKQHLELTRDIAQAFNSLYEVDYFPLPEPQIFGGATRVMSLRDGTKKMSKSDPSDYSRLNMTDDADAIAQKIRKAKTDPLPLPASVDDLSERAEALNLVTLFSALAERPIDDILKEFEGKGFGDFKSALADLSVSVLAPIGSEMSRLVDDPAEIDKILNAGAERADALAQPILAEVKKIVGFLGP